MANVELVADGKVVVIESRINCLVRRYKSMITLTAVQLKGRARDIEALASLFAREYGFAKSTGNLDAMEALHDTVRLGRGSVFTRLWNKFRKAVDLPEVSTKKIQKVSLTKEKMAYETGLIGRYFYAQLTGEHDLLEGYDLEELRQKARLFAQELLGLSNSDQVAVGGLYELSWKGTWENPYLTIKWLDKNDWVLV